MDRQHMLLISHPSHGRLYNYKVQSDCELLSAAVVVLVELLVVGVAAVFLVLRTWGLLLELVVVVLKCQTRVHTSQRRYVRVSVCCAFVFCLTSAALPHIGSVGLYTECRAQQYVDPR